jgi:hypothetical protein
VLPCRGFAALLQRYRGNEHLMAAPRTPMANLFMSIAAKEDIELDTFGDSTGALEI